MHGQADVTPTVSIPLLLLATISVLLAAISFSFIFWIYKWRKKSKEGLVIVPEAFSEDISKIEKTGIQLTDTVVNTTSDLQTQVQILNDNFQQYDESLNILKNTITTHDENLSKHEQRWDIYVTRKFFRNLINAYEISKEEYDQLSKTDPDGVATQSMVAINYELNNALEDAEIEKFSPKVGSLYATQVGISERTGKLVTDDPEKVGKIAKVNKPGYKMKKIDPESKSTIIKESVVTVYISPHSGGSD